ncbi:LPXTG cell wall anchor domain-containing protein [Fundicoccus sp. Sow4_H7]|uniref:LPXTG cell wall anchor domain-containing protein n=1 Tax=Fundicoccus sp. Sow4_H7 TaxID=3438784 RepID=UPI003F91B977
MKLKKTFFRSACALALIGAGVSPVLSNFVSPQISTVVQAQQDDTLSAEEQNRVAVIKDNVAGFEPVNLEQLLEVSDRDLLDYDNIAQSQSTDVYDVWGSIYNQIAENYPHLNLLRGEDYEAYERAAEAISERSEYTYSDLNMALPRLTLERYRSAMANNEDNVDNAVAEILPAIEQTIDEYIVRREERQKDEDDNSDEEAAQNLRQELIGGTPMLQNQLNQFDDATLVALADELNQTGGDISTLYNRLVEDYPEVFASESQRMRDALVNEFNLNETELDAVLDAELFWEELTIFNDGNVENFERLAQVMEEKYNVSRTDDESESEDDSQATENLRNELIGGTPMLQNQLDQFDDETLLALADELNQAGGDISSLYNRLVEDYPEVFASESQRMRDALVNEFNLNEAELDEVSDAELFWEELAIFNDGNVEDFERLAQVMEEKYNVSSTDESEEDDTQAAENLRNELIGGTPMLQAQLDQFDDETLLALADELNQAGGDISSLYNHLVANYPDVFASESQRMRNALVNDYGLDEAALSNVSDEELFWAEFAVFNENNKVEDFGALANRLAEEFNIPRESQSESESESQSESESEEASRSVSIETSVESNESSKTESGDLLPETGETSSTWLIVLSVILLVAAGFLIYRGRNKVN